jgi:prolyl 4-hydroxylase
VPLDDPVVRCIESRATSFQGFDTPAYHVEPIQLVRYASGEHYHFHTDWFIDPAHSTARHGGQRVSSFFGYVGVGEGTTGGGTNFPILNAPADERWCRFVDCDEEYERGVTFKPIEGNVVYWQNVGEDGKGDERTLHAGLPVTSGWKVGMNIWTREGPLGEDVRGEWA